MRRFFMMILKRQIPMTNVQESTTSFASLYPGGLKIALPIVNIVAEANGNTIHTQALRDPGSNRSCCTLKLAHDLELQGEDQVLSLETLHGIQDAKGKEVVFEVSAQGKKRRCIHLRGVLAMKTFPVLNGSVVDSSDVKQWDHL